MRLSAATSGGEGKGSRLKLQFTGPEPSPTSPKPTGELSPRGRTGGAGWKPWGRAARSAPGGGGGFAEVLPAAYPSFPRERENLPQGLQT